MAVKLTLTSELLSLNIGDKKEYPLSRCTSIRSMASSMSLMHDRIYKTETDRETKTITVTRIS